MTKATTEPETPVPPQIPWRNWVVVSILAGLTLFAAVAELFSAPGSWLGRVAPWMVALLSLAAAGLGSLVARARILHNRSRQAWTLLAIAWCLTAGAELANVMWNARDSQQSVHWFLPVVTSPLFFVALLSLPPRSLSRPETLVTLLDVITVVLSGWIVVWHVLVGAAVGRGITASLDGQLVMMGLLADLALLGGASYLLLRCPKGARRRTVMFIAISAAAVFATDVLRAGVLWGAVTSDLASVAALLPPFFFVLAGIEKRDRLAAGHDDDDALGTRPVAALPYVAVMVTYGVLVRASIVDPGSLFTLLIFAGGLPVCVLARQAVAASETTRLARERAMMAGDARFRAIVQRSSDLVMVVDNGWILTFVSPSVEGLLGFPCSQLIGTSVLDLVHPEDSTDATNRLRESASDASRSMPARWRLRRMDRSYLDMDTVSVNLLADPDVRGLVLTARDASEHRSLEAQLTHQAFHDQLTGLANRALFEDRVQHSLARRRGADLDAMGVVFIDLDYFKMINDTLGHAGGDALLRAAAARLVGSLRAFDTAARLGGDEFAVLVDDIHQRGDVVQVAERITRAFAEPFVIDGRQVQGSASIGVAVASSGQTAGDLLRNADLAMYLAKSRGRGQYAVFEPSMHAAAMTRLELQRDLSHALERGEFSLVYQPVHALESGALAGAEAFLRWIHPARGPIPPGTFVPLAEEAGLMLPIGRWVLARACRDAQSWRKLRRGRGLRVSVNLSGRQIPEESLFEDVEEAVRTSGLEPGALVLELTEPMLVQHPDSAQKLLRKLKTLGVRIAIDDFGTGYSSLSHLQRLPIDILKIDRTFVDTVTKDEHAAQFTRTIVSLSESMSLVTIAEGIETAAQAERLRALGCDFGQGYHFGMPMSAEALGNYADRSRMLVG